MQVWRAALGVLAWTLVGGCALAAEPASRASTGEAVLALGRDAVWTQVSATPIGFDSFHAQGMVKVGEDFFVSSVEILERSRRYPEPRGGFDRDQGRGQGWLFRMNAKGELLGSLKLGEGAIYHPGGLDFDGGHLWIPVAEYRPGGPSIIYRVDPRTMIATEAFRVGDHIGAIAWDPATRSLTGANWGSRAFYQWSLGPGFKPRRTSGPTPNRAHYVDYQDCHGAGPRRMLCAGLADYRGWQGQPPHTLGGMELIDLADLRPLWQAPVQARSPAGVVMTSNPAWFEAVPGGVRGWFLPEDGRGALYVYEVRPPRR
jgi:hypothetical protein